MANLPKIALGAWAWGNDGTFGNSLTAESLKPIFDTAMANGLSDTALHKDVSDNVKWAKGKQINRPNETEIRRWLNEVL